MNDSQTQAEPLPPVAVPVTVEDVEQLLNSSDVFNIKLSREGRKWRCEARSLRASGGAEAKSMVQAVHDAVAAHNTEWEKVIGA